MEASVRLPSQPVRLWSDDEDPCVRRLQIFSVDSGGLLLKLCDLLTSHGIDISTASIATEDGGVVNNCFELQTSRPWDLGDACDWCQEIQSFLSTSCKERESALEDSIASISKRLSVNRDLLSVVAFDKMDTSDGHPSELHYRLELGGINQAGLLTYAALVLYKSGFSVVNATISTHEGHIADSFELATTSVESQQLLRLYLDVPSLPPQCPDVVPLPFHATQSDADLQALMLMWRAGQVRSPCGSFNSPAPSPPMSPQCSRQASSNCLAQLGEAPAEIGAGSNEAGEQHGGARRRRLSSSDCEVASVNGASPRQSLRSGQAAGAASRREARESRRSSSDADSRTAHKMSVHFQNGDVFSGKCVMFDGGEKRHGLGTYKYSEKTHDTYKQYRGQWREDRKHGYGVLFYRNGGVYVGQWENNRKHGLGVELDNADNGGAGMPSYRYEGQWQEDEQHGLGTEENDTSSYFGHFENGRRWGRGVRMTFSRMGVAGWEVIDSSQRVLPLLDALAAEISRRRQDPEAQAPFDSVAFDLEGVAVVPQRAATSGLALAGGCSDGHRGSGGRPRQHGSSGGPPQSGTSSSAYIPLATPQLESQETPHLGAGRCDERPSRIDLRAGALVSPASPLEGQQTPMPGVRVSPATGHRGQALSQAAALEVVRDVEQPTSPGPQLNGGTHGHAAEEEGGSVVFELKELNDLLSPRLSRDLRGDAAGLASAEETPANGGTNGLLCGGARSTAAPMLRQQVPPRVAASVAGGSRPGEQGSAAGAAATASAALADAALAAAAAATRGSSPGPAPLSPGAPAEAPDGDRRQRQPIRKPLLWSEDELAAFISCLGLDDDIRAKVQQGKIKGVAHVLAMSNTELRREFGLATPVERLVLRQSLKRLLDADRWENSVRGHNIRDILKDSVLGRFMLPHEDLTLIKKISQGGYGTVYSGVLEQQPGAGGAASAAAPGARQQQQQQLVAAKEMKGDPRFRLLELLKEACVMASLRHKNICAFIGVCEDRSGAGGGGGGAAQGGGSSQHRKHYIISELMDCSLFDLIHQPHKLHWHGELTTSLVVELAQGISAGIVYIHAKNLVHADLKSSNILIDYSSSSEWVPRICDFGHAAVRTFPTPHHRCGTPHWAGPEVLRGEALGPAADIFSFGVIMWEMLTQKQPHKGLSFGQVLAAVGWAGWTPNLEALPEVPPLLRELIRDCMSFSPASRPSGREVQRRIRRVPRHARLEALRMLSTFFFG